MHNFHCKIWAIPAIYFKRLPEIITNKRKCYLLFLYFEGQMHLYPSVYFIFMLQF